MNSPHDGISGDKTIEISEEEFMIREFIDE